MIHHIGINVQSANIRLLPVCDKTYQRTKVKYRTGTTLKFSATVICAFIGKTNILKKHVSCYNNINVSVLRRSA